MRAWLCTPSARRAAEAQPIVDMWRDMGYGVMLWRDVGAEALRNCDVIEGGYPGHAQAANSCCRAALNADPECNWCVIAGDDTEPDHRVWADHIAGECEEHFRPVDWRGQIIGDFIGSVSDLEEWLSRNYGLLKAPTYGVMQPTGDRFNRGNIDQICGSPFVGRTFIDRAYEGNGPLWHEYWHMFDDNELHDVAEMAGVLWNRRDLVHLHHHFQRENNSLTSNAVYKPVPEFLVRANSPENWHAMKAIYESRKRLKFPGALPPCASSL